VLQCEVPVVALDAMKGLLLLLYIAVFCCVLQYAAVCCSVLQCVAVCCNVLQCEVPVVA